MGHVPYTTAEKELLTCVYYNVCWQQDSALQCQLLAICCFDLVHQVLYFTLQGNAHLVSLYISGKFMAQTPCLRALCIRKWRGAWWEGTFFNV